MDSTSTWIGLKRPHGVLRPRRVPTLNPPAPRRRSTHEVCAAVTDFYLTCVLRIRFHLVEVTDHADARDVAIDRVEIARDGTPVELPDDLFTAAQWGAFEELARESVGHPGSTQEDRLQIAADSLARRTFDQAVAP